MNLLYNSTIAGLWTSFCIHFPFSLTACVTVEHSLVAGIVVNKWTNLSFHVQAASLPFCLNTHCPLFMDLISLSLMFIISPGEPFLPARTVPHARVFSFAKSRNSAGLTNTNTNTNCPQKDCSPFLQVLLIASLQHGEPPLSQDHEQSCQCTRVDPRRTHLMTRKE